MRRVFSKVFLLTALAFALQAAEPILVPQIDGDFWQVAGDPDLGKYTTPKQQPVDFGIWQAADGTWQLWSCIRSTAAPGKTRLFYRWQGKNLTDTDWTPMGIAMMADPNFGETEGGLQAPFVLKEKSVYYMFYGNWEHIALATSVDGKTFARQLTRDGRSPVCSARKPEATRAIPWCSRSVLFITATTPLFQIVTARISCARRRTRSTGALSEGRLWRLARRWPVFGRMPICLSHHAASGYYYLLRNQFYGVKAQFAVYRSRNPLDFGKNDDRYLVETMPYAAPEIIESGRTTLPRRAPLRPQRYPDSQIEVRREGS